MPKAARLGDPIGHSPTMSWLINGLLIGGAIAVAGVLIAGTGGLAAAAIVAGMAAGGAGIGEVLSTMSWAPKEVVGAILGACSTNVFINKRPAARAHVDMVQCAKHPNGPIPVATGSSNVYLNGQPAARLGDKTGCGGDITDGSANVFIGGETQQTDVVNPEDLVPGWVHAALLTVGVASGLVFASPIVVVAGLIGGIGGGYVGGRVGGYIWGEGSDGQKWALLGGSIIGGIFGAKGGAAIEGKFLAAPANTAGVSPESVAFPKARYVFDARAGRYRDTTTGRFAAARDLPWPSNAGFASSARKVVQPGTILDRYGNPTGRFLGEPGTTISQRGMAAGSDGMPYTQYRILKPVEMQVGPAAPVPQFGASGGAKQYLSGRSVQQLIEEGFLETIK